MRKRVFKIGDAVRIMRVRNAMDEKCIFADMWGNSESFICLDTEKNRFKLARKLREIAAELEWTA